MNKIAVVFPGVGYTKDRPLLYYSGKMAVKKGYELIHIDFTGLDWSKDRLKDKEFLDKTMKKCLLMTEEALKNIPSLSGKEKLAGDDVVFISKSIGTVVATAYARKMGINAAQICFSPLEMIEEYVDGMDAVLFYGDADPYADFHDIERIASEKHLKTFCVAGGNHSLETGDILIDVGNLKSILDRVSELIR